MHAYVRANLYQITGAYIYSLPAVARSYRARPPPLALLKFGGRRRKRSSDQQLASHGRHRGEANTPGLAAAACVPASARDPLVDGAVRLHGGPRQLLPDVLVPVHHVRADGGDRGPRVDVGRRERGDLPDPGGGDGGPVPVGVHLLLPHQDARPVRAPGDPLPGLLRLLLLSALRSLPAVPRAQEPRLRHGNRVAGEHGAAGAGRRRPGDRASRRRDDPLIGSIVMQLSSVLASLATYLLIGSRPYMHIVFVYSLC